MLLFDFGNGLLKSELLPLWLQKDRQPDFSKSNGCRENKRLLSPQGLPVLPGLVVHIEASP